MEKEKNWIEKTIESGQERLAEIERDKKVAQEKIDKILAWMEERDAEYSDIVDVLKKFGAKARVSIKAATAKPGSATKAVKQKVKEAKTKKKSNLPPVEKKVWDACLCEDEIDVEKVSLIVLMHNPKLKKNSAMTYAGYYVKKLVSEGYFKPSSPRVRGADGHPARYTQVKMPVTRRDIPESLEPQFVEGGTVVSARGQRSYGDKR